MAKPVRIASRVCPFEEGTPEAEQWFASYYASHTSAKWKPKKKGKIQPVIAALDFETDPFAGAGNEIAPFCAGFFDGVIYREFWGDDCANDVCEYIKTLDEPHIIYAHNGGRFDFTFMLAHLLPDVFMIGSRITQARILGRNGLVHELRDSYSAMPVPLKDTGGKLKFDYGNLTRSKRDKYRQEILTYLRADCAALHSAIVAWRAEFGNGLTMASAAIKKLHKAMVPQGSKRKTVHSRLTPEQDEEMRRFYFGGRVQVFEPGIIQGELAQFKIYDITSSYPNVMRKYAHPVSAGYRRGMKDITPLTDFAHIEAISDGCLPVRDALTGKLEFPKGKGTFFATGHEIRAGMRLGLLKVLKIHESMQANERSDFAAFVDHYFNSRQERRAWCKANGIDDSTDHLVLFWKLVLNSSYGKFAQNPRKFKDRYIVRLGEPMPPLSDGWVLSERYSRMDVYERQSDQAHAWRSYLNVATGASITGAARAELMEGIANAARPIYCDTDSLICEHMPPVYLGSGLGKWKLEAVADTLAICQRKTYAAWDNGVRDFEAQQKSLRNYGDAACVKLASKGVRLSAAQIMEVAGGKEVEYHPLAPTIKLDGSQIWTSRKVRMSMPVAGIAS